MMDGDVRGQANAVPHAIQQPSANETLYIQNLNENVKLPVLKQSLEALFSTYGKVLSVIAHSNVRMRGQAFVSFKSSEIATKAMQEVNGFPLYGKAMRITFAKSKSDSVVKHLGGPDGENALEKHKAQRLEKKPISRRRNVLREREMQRKRKAAEIGVPVDSMEFKSNSLARVQANQLPDEYLPPNKLLFLQHIPTTTTREALQSLFGNYPNLVEVRTIPGRSDIAFVEYSDIPSGVQAREATNGVAMPNGERIKVSYARA
ncbi:hypothetical protein MYAM1_000984 [Malassezia yamatoensis]|uniref:RRM domain-containing protein n=1 Tax=Malassezia yamatoensis TaxID=253288 RepID=A0AAJ5YXH3_9BASI|nr:hypothetical protein MYAM1_000984 [Malassezia yamatoensis]